MRVFAVLVLGLFDYDNASSLLPWNCRFIVNCFQFFANLAQSHGCIREDLVLRDLLLNYLCEDNLERQAKSAFFEIFFEH